MGMWGEINKGVQAAGATGMGLLQLQNLETHQRSLEAIAKQTAKEASDLHTVQLQKENIALEQAKQVEAEANRPIYKESFPVMFPGMAENPNSADKIMTELPWKKDASGREFITQRDREFFKNRVKSDADLAYNMTTAQVADLGGKHANLLQQFNELASNPPKTPEKMQEWETQKQAIQKKISDLDLQYKTATDHLNDLDPKVREARAKPKQADSVPYRTPTGETVLIDEKDPRSQTVITEKKLVRSSDFKPEGANQTEEQLTARALKGDKEATAILEAMDSRKIARETRVSNLVDQRSQNRLNVSQDKADRVFAVSLRKELNGLPEIKESNQIMPKIANMEKAYKEAQTTKNFVAVDQALITLYNKLTDPSSVVRESEYARTAQNIPLINAVKGKFQKVLEGGAGLTNEERAALLKMAQLMRQGYQEIRGNRMKEYRSYASGAGLNGGEVIKDVYETAPPSGPQKVGRFTVERVD